MHTRHDAAVRIHRCAALSALLLALACGDSPTATAPTCREAVPIQIDDEVRGTLGPGDARFQDAFIDYYALTLRERTRVVVRLSSSRLDPFLYLFGPDTGVIAQAFARESSPAGTEEAARLVRTLGPGCHILGASSWGPDGTGEYTLRTAAVELP